MPHDAAVPEGASVRVDLSSGGQRWVESNETSATNEAADGGTAAGTCATAVAVAPPDGGVEARWRASVDTATRREDPTEAKTPREAMLSAFKKLPESEWRAIAEGVESLEELDLLSDERLKAVWGVRQEQLREASEQLSDNAKRLKRRIAALEGFRARTSARCDAAADPTTPVVTAASDEDERSAVDELESLEYELGDVDDARDFHGALGGLPPLALSRRRTVSLVSRARASLTGIFARARFSSEEEEEESQVALLSPRFSRAVRAAAAAALGSAVKNEATHQLWTLEPLGARVENGSALALLVAALGDDCDGRGTPDAALLHLWRKALYASGAAVRRNDATRAAFVALGGRRVLLECSEQALRVVEAKPRESAAAWDVVTKATTLLDDLLFDDGAFLPAAAGARELGEGDDDDVPRRWCALFSGALSVAPPNRNAERVLRAAGALAERCDDVWRSTPALGVALSELSRALGSSAALDDDYRDELASLALDLVDRVSA